MPEERSTELKAGWIEVICGSMFSGKTEELIRRLKRAHIANKKVGIFKPAADTRYHETNVVSHDANFIPSIPVEHSNEIIRHSSGIEVVGIDEAQFFDAALVDTCETLAKSGARVIIAGLDMDFEGKPFGPVPYLLSVADYITKVHAVCVQCGEEAQFSFRKTQAQNRFLLGDKDNYEPRCRNCYYRGLYG